MEVENDLIVSQIPYIYTNHLVVSRLDLVCSVPGRRDKDVELTPQSNISDCTKFVPWNGIDDEVRLWRTAVPDISERCAAN